MDTGDSGQETCIAGIRFLKMSLLIMALHCRWARFEARDATRTSLLRGGATPVRPWLGRSAVCPFTDDIALLSTATCMAEFLFKDDKRDNLVGLL